LLVSFPLERKSARQEGEGEGGRERGRERLTYLVLVHVILVGHRAELLHFVLQEGTFLGGDLFGKVKKKGTGKRKNKCFWPFSRTM